MKCYDDLVERGAAASEAGAAGSRDEPGDADDTPPQPEAVVEPEPPQTTEITDDVGREQIEPAGDKNTVEYRGRVTQCKKNSSGRVFFFLENGQIWKQTDYARMRYRVCDFEITLTRDAFGYKMKIIDKKASYRVSRVK